MSLLPTLINTANEILGDAESPYALFMPANRSIGTIIADVTVREVHVDEDTITVFPVETGTPISDHVFANPQVVEISCGFSDSSAGYAGYVQAVYQQMLALKATKEPFDVFTGKRAYQNMLFANITVVTDETSEYALMVTARLQEVIITNTSGSGSSSGLNNANQANPANTASETDFGTQSLQFVPSAQGYSPNLATAGTIGTSGLLAFQPSTTGYGNLNAPF